MKSSLHVMNSENVELRKAHDSALKELSQFKDDNEKLTDKILKIKEEQMKQLDEWQQEFEKYAQFNRAHNVPMADRRDPMMSRAQTMHSSQTS